MAKVIGLRVSDEQYAELQRRAGRNISSYIRAQLGFEHDPAQDAQDQLDDHERRITALEDLAAGQGAY